MFKFALRDIGPALALLVMICVFALASRQFLSVENIRVILESSAIPVILVVGLTFVLLQGSIDLSIEGVMATSSMIVALLVKNSMTPYDLGWVGVAIAIATGTAFGFVNGIIFTLVRMPSMIVTLATWFVGLGVATLLFPGRQPEILAQEVSGIVLNRHAGLSLIVYAAVVAAVVGALVQNYSQFGRLSYAIGQDERMARQSGRSVRFHKTAAFMLMGTLAGLGGVFISAQLGVGNPDAGTGFLFPAISAAVVGGTLLSGGRGGVLHSVVGVLILEVLRNGMIQIGVDPYLRHVVEGFTIIIALIAGNWRLRSRLRVVK
ncbi:putative Ribose/xylose/arabinose/galactoside ABC-type transport system, permease components AraH [Agrobacterium tumefaciens str. Kerr 14]|uniref:Putative Ribose/xylose/arabinose/galactoside ABC-type transport system, permease components AraH n=1 Tax=Agrobacterium tumefaciens str. Kerr 14 TaxID=1183424 RepID=A0A1S7SAM6_AGRTU|nr:ABC transporter permease [Agrobacterium tumefaciens]CUX65237.1 putative Ribose/xylose/arabinose/galactoside ABC-type transport system, permease components AraH [Agrobacterium tumefaciens str. Kerr 14]